MVTTTLFDEHLSGASTLLRTGLIARLRLWRTLRAARIFIARSQMPEALRAFRLALEIYPGCTAALTFLAAHDMRERLTTLEARCAVLETQLDKGATDERWQPLEQRLRAAEAATIVARADWQSSRRQVDMRMDRLEQETAHLHGSLEAAVRNAVEIVEARAARAETLNAQLHGLAGQMDLALEHLTALKALSLVVGRQQQDIAALRNVDMRPLAPPASSL